MPSGHVRGNGRLKHNCFASQFPDFQTRTVQISKFWKQPFRIFGAVPEVSKLPNFQMFFLYYGLRIPKLGSKIAAVQTAQTPHVEVAYERAGKAHVRTASLSGGGKISLVLVVISFDGTNCGLSPWSSAKEKNEYKERKRTRFGTRSG